MRCARHAPLFFTLALACGTAWADANEQAAEDLTKAFGTFGQSIQAETTKNASAKIAARQGVAAYKAENDLRLRANDASTKLSQPEVICESVNNANKEATVGTNARITAAHKAASLSDKALYASGSGKPPIIQSYEAAISTFCSTTDAALGRCATPVAPLIQSGDMRAEFLFGDGAGSLTRDAKQNIAADKVVERIVNPAEGPAPLPDTTMEKTVQGKAYVVAARRYAALKSLVAYSLTSISANHAPAKSLGK